MAFAPKISQKDLSPPDSNFILTIQKENIQKKSYCLDSPQLHVEVRPPKILS